MNANFFSRIELIFWNLAIQTLSESSFTRKFIRNTYQFVNSTDVTSLGIMMGVSGIFGLFSGYLFYFLTIHMR